MSLNLYNIMESLLTESVSRDEVISALNDKRVVAITYNDEKPNPPLGTRWIEPCSLVDMGHGKYGIRAYAYNGATRRGVPDWKLFRLDRILTWKPTTSTFHKAPDDRYNPNGDKQYTVIAQVKFDNDDLMLQRNLNNDVMDNQYNNVDYFGRYINKPNQPKQGPVGNPPNMSQMQNQNGPVMTQAMKKARQDAWRKKHDLEYRRAKREKERAELWRRKQLGDEEDEMMNAFDNEPLFPNNDI